MLEIQFPRDYWTDESNAVSWGSVHRQPTGRSGHVRSDDTHAEFHTTSWTLVDAIRDDDHPMRQEALDLLIRRYWPPVYACIRRMGHGREMAAELTQAFYADVVLGRKLFSKADAGSGRVRSLLQTALKRYLIDQHRRRTSRPDQIGISLEDLVREEDYIAEVSDQDAGLVFERRWAMAILEEALARTEKYYTDSARGHYWAAFDAFEIRPATGAVDRPRQSDLADQLGFPSALHVATAISEVRKRLRLLLTEAVAETSADPVDRKAEYERVVSLLS